MGYQVYLYEWPESQECLECKFSQVVQLQKGYVWTDHKTICGLNHDKTKEDNCSCFTLREEETINPNQ